MVSIAPRTPGTFALNAKIREYEDEKCPGTPSTYASKLSFITVG